MKLAPFLCVIGALLMQAACSTGPHPGDVVSEKVADFSGKRYIHQRIIITTDPYETELRTVQIR